ncbi:MAG: hypothetical protein IJ827_07120 [Lachnospiraceae bacterium]|nr:hypothetical protein [Lachnospiraceae bacterium]
MRFLNWAVDELGFGRNTKYQKQYLNETNIRTAVYMSFIVMILEVWMIIRYVQQRPGRTFLEYYDGESNYLILFSSALIIFAFAPRYTKGGTVTNLCRLTASLVIFNDIIMIVRNAAANIQDKSPLQVVFGIKYHILLLILATAYLIYEICFLSAGRNNDL